jgi:hypothetical protein
MIFGGSASDALPVGSFPTIVPPMSVTVEMIGADLFVQHYVYERRPGPSRPGPGRI